MRSRAALLALAAFAASLYALPAAAQSKQTAKEAPKEAPKSAPPAADEGPPTAYEPQLLRLAEILGALVYLQDVCGSADAAVWRSKMTALIEAEGNTPLRKERLAGAFNRGFRGYELSYRVCTPNAQAIITRFLAEAGRIARDVTSRYGAT